MVVVWLLFVVILRGPGLRSALPLSQLRFVVVFLVVGCCLVVFVVGGCFSRCFHSLF